MDFLLNFKSPQQTVTYFRNVYQPIQYVYTYILEKSSFISDIVESIKSGKKIFIFSTSKQFLQQLLQVLSQMSINIKYYDSNCEVPSVRLNEEWSDANVVMFTPKIIYGLSYTLKDFDRGYAYAGNNSAVVCNIMQAIRRVRYLKEGTIYIHEANSFGQQTPSMLFRSELKKIIKQNGKEITKLEKSKDDEIKFIAVCVYLLLSTSHLVTPGHVCFYVLSPLAL